MKVAGGQSTSETDFRKIISHKSALLLTVVVALFVTVSTSNHVGKLTQRAFQVYYGDSGFGRYGSDSRLTSILRSMVNVDDYGREDLEVVKIDIKYESWSKITKKASEAISAGFIVQSDDDYVPAKVSFRGKEVRADIRLKGDMIDHLKGRKWSFRVKIKGGSSVLGLKKFNIQNPLTRGFHTQFVINKVFEDYSLIVQKHELVRVVINGEDIGIMLIEEHFAKELLERNKKKDGVIVKFDETNLWESLRLNRGQPALWKEEVNPFHSPYTSNIDVYSRKKVMADDYFRAQYETAVSLLDGFRRGMLQASEVFDVDAMGHYLAILSFFKAGHDSTWTNLRFYLNPYTIKLEPIPSEANVGYEIPIASDSFIRSVLVDPKINVAYRDTLNDLNLKYRQIDNLKALKESQEPYLSILKKEFFFLEDINADLLGSCVPMSPLAHPTLVDVKLTVKEQKYFLEVSNITCKEIAIKSLTQTDNTQKFEFSVPVVLAPVTGGDVLRPHTINLEGLGFSVSADSNFLVEVYDGEARSTTASRSTQYPAFFTSPPFLRTDISELQASHRFISVDGSNVIFSSGEHEVEGHVAIPCGYNVTFSGGTTLSFDTDGFIFSCSPIRVSGTSAEKVILQPKAEGGSWRGLAVYNAREKSIIRNLHVRNTSEFQMPHINLTGGVTFYNSDVDIYDSIFTDSIGEDALNIVHSEMHLERIKIQNTLSDAFDGDFVTGRVVNSNFSNIGYGGGGDAVDVSGSEIIVDGGTFLNINDKAVSIGEASDAVIKNVSIKRSNIAIASKDASTARGENLDIDTSNNRFFMSYMKKPVYGGAKIVIDDFGLANLENKFVAQVGSSLIVNGKAIKETSIDVDAMYGK